MAQFARPQLDVTRVDVVDQADAIVNLFTKLNEAVADDAGYLRTGLAPVSSVYVCKFSPLVDPVSSSGYILRVRLRKDATSGALQDCLVELRQGYVNEGSLGTLIHDTLVTDLAGADWATTELTLAGAEADAITNHADLYGRLVYTTQP